MQEGRLVVKVYNAPYRRAYTVLVALSGIMLLLLIGYLIAARTRPSFWLFIALGMVVLLALAARAKELLEAGRNDVIFIDKEADQILRNGKALAPVSKLDHILVRQVLQDETPLPEYALVFALDDTRRLTISESYQVEGGKEEIEQAARKIAEFTGVKVQEATRQASEWWLDK
jgi:hypothetical protein